MSPEEDPLHPLALFCKSYRGDLERCAELVASVRRHNRERLPFYLAVPAADRALFVDRLGAEAVELLSDEEVIGGTMTQSWTAQQLVKLRFASVGLAKNYLWIDSDFAFVRDFGQADFLARPDVPFVVLAEFRRNPFQDRLLGAPGDDPEYARMLAGLERPFALIRDTFGRNGPLYFYGPPCAWSSTVVHALEAWLKTRGLSFEMMLSLSPFELNWYAEFLFATQVIPVVPSQDLAFHFTRDREYQRFVAAGFTVEDLASRGYLAVNFASKWMSSVAISTPTLGSGVRTDERADAAPVSTTATVATVPRGVDLGAQWRGSYHRVGWGWALDALQPLHRAGGVLVEGFIEKKFGWGQEPGDRLNGFQAHRRPWIGFWHNPPGVPEWFNGERQSPHDILAGAQWRESAPSCQGLFTLSESLARWLRPRVGVPVCALKHPSAPPSVRFSLDAYRSNPTPSVVQIGWWLRRSASLHALPLPKTLRKAFLDLRARLPWLGVIMARELELLRHDQRSHDIVPVPYLGSAGYDHFLASNLVFHHLYDASATNTLIECILRHTPVLVNPLDAVVEYLGPDYPFYFTTLEEAAAKAEDEGAIAAAHQYLEGLPVQAELTQEAFRRSFLASEIGRRLGVG